MGDDETILRYSTFEVNGALRLGLITKNGVLDLHKVHEWFSWTSSNAGALSASTYASMEAFLRNREAAHSAVRVILESVMETPEAHDELFHGSAPAAVRIVTDGCGIGDSTKRSRTIASCESVPFSHVS